MRISFRTRVHLGVAALMFVFIVTLVAILSPWLSKDKSNFLQEITSQVANGGSHLLAERLDSWKEELRMFSDWSAERKGGMRMTPSFVFSSRSPFLAAGVVIRNTKNEWEFVSLERNSKFQSKDLGEHNAEFLRNLNLKELNLSSISENEVRVVHVPKDAGETLFAVLTLTGAANGVVANAKISLGLTTEKHFSDLTRVFKGSFTEYFIIDQYGRVVAHPNDALVGTRLNHNPVVAHTQQSSRRTFSGEVIDDPDLALYSSYVRLADTNLISIATAPLQIAQAPIKSALLFAVVLSFVLAGVLLFSLRALWSTQDRTWRLLGSYIRELRKGNMIAQPKLALNSNLSEEDRLIREVHSEIDELSLSRRSFVESATQEQRSESAPTSRPEVASSVKILSPETLLSLRLEAFEEAGQGITKELKNPVAAVLGHIQLAMGKSENPELQKHLNFIDLEVRHIKDITDKIAKLGFYRTLQLSPKESDLIVLDALALAEVEVQMAGVRLHKDFFPVPKIRVSETEFVKVLSDVIASRARAMSKSDSKNLIVHLEPKEDRVLIRIEDNAPNLLEDEISSLVKPFNPQALSLVGLNFKLLNLGALMLTHGGKITVAVGVNNEKGNVIVLDFPGHFEKSDSHAVPSSTFDESYAFVEKKLETLEEHEALGADSQRDLPIPPPVPGSLTEFSVKVRRPRLNL